MKLPIPLLVGIGIHGRVTKIERAFALHPSNTSARIQAYQAALRELPQWSGPGDAFGFGQRLEVLGRWATRERTWVDLNVVGRIINAYWNQIEAIARADRTKRRTLLRRLQDDDDRLVQKVKDFHAKRTPSRKFFVGFTIAELSEAYTYGALSIEAPVVVDCLDEWDSRDVRDRLSTIVFALARFRSDHNRFPKSLAELVPRFLAEVPADPFDGKPLRYRRTTVGFALYSVGPDGKQHQRAQAEFQPNDDLRAVWPLGESD